MKGFSILKNICNGLKENKKSREPKFKNIFVLCTGRCGSTTFIQACKHIKNYSSGHETLSHCYGVQRLAYPTFHIEADNRLSWILGRLENTYKCSNNIFYVHLIRNKKDTAQSFVKRWDYGIMKAYREAIIMGGGVDDKMLAAEDYYDTVNTNIEFFLSHKTNKMIFHLETAEEDWKFFCKAISADVDMSESLKEWSVKYNKSKG